MSLFPAYPTSQPEKEDQKDDQNKSWLANGSFPTTETDKLPGGGCPLSNAGPVVSTGDTVSTLSTVCVAKESDGDVPPSVGRDGRQRRRRSRSRSSSHSPARHKHRKHRPKKHKHRDRSPPRPAAEPPPLRGVFLEDAGIRPEVAFSVDRRPDRAARAFSEMYYHHVARYVRVRGVLGRPKVERRPPMSRYYDRRWRRRLRHMAAGMAPVCRLPAHHSYVPLSAERPGRSEQPEEAADYLGSLSSDVLFEFGRDTAELNRRLALTPGDAPLWLEMVQFQQRRLAGRVTEQQLLDRQLAVLERALRHCPASAALRLRRLELRQPDQPPEEAAKEWTQLLFSHPADLGVWRRYLASQLHRPGFTLPAAVSACSRCLEKMRQFQADAVRPHRPPAGLELFMLEVVHHLCRVLRQAGYTERAVAVYQALLELNLFSPPLDVGGALGAMEPFWDSRLPRVGEPGARGWPTELAARRDRPAAAGQGQGDGEEEPADEVEDRLLSAGGPRPDTWRSVESRRAERHWLAWDRPGHEDDCEDTDRIVLFEDVRRFLFRVAPELQAQLVDDFVAFLCGEERETVENSEDDTLQMLAADASALLPPPGISLPLDGVDSSVSPLTMPPLGPRIDSFEYSAFVVRVLEQSAGAVPADQRTRLLRRTLWFLTRRVGCLSARDDAAAASVVKETRRRMKSMLKSERQNVPLFVEYAEFERTTGSSEMAGRVLETALAQSAAADPVRFQLVHRFCLLRLPSSAAACRTVLCALFGEPAASAGAPQLARVVSRLRRLVPELTGLSAGGRVPQTVVPVTCCLAWSQLLTAGVQEAADVLTAVLGDLSKSQTREVNSVTGALHRAGCQLLAAARPLADPLSWLCHLQRALRAALARLPLDAELSRLAVRHCPVPWRQQLSAAPDSDPPLLSLLRAAADVSRLPTTAVAAARLRRRLARLVQLPQLRHWPSLWLLYLELELRTGGKDLEAVCYRAVQACPWSKQVYLYLSRRQLRRACELMTRAGLRLRLPLEELDVLLEEEPEQLQALAAGEQEQEQEAQLALRREADSGTGTESASDSDSESEGHDSGPGTPSPPL